MTDAIELIPKLAEHGPGFAVAAIFLILYILERKKNTELISNLHELSLSALKTDHEHTTVYKSIEATMSTIEKTLKAISKVIIRGT